MKLSGVCGLFLAAIVAVASAYAQEDIVPKSRSDLTFSYAPVVKKAAPAVVNIYTKQHVTVTDSISPFMNDPFFQQFFAQQGLTFGGRAREQVVSSLGSGVLIKPDGMIVTSYHVVQDAQKITVVLSDKREFEATVVLKDPKSDLAFLKISTPEPLPFLEMRDSDTLEVGDLVLAIGNPFGVGQTVTNGIVSALARKAEGVSDYQFFIQTDAAINPGNSGGALVDMNGRLVGINTAIYSKSGGSLGIGFAIPANMVRSLEGSKVQGGRVVHSWLGMSTQAVTPEIAESIGMKSAQGVIVKSMYPDSPAEKAGIKVGDIILSVNGAAIASDEDLQYRLVLSKIGETGTFKILRNGTPETIEVVLAEPPENPKRDLRTLSGRTPLSGLTVANLSPALATELGIDMGATGVVVAGVGKNNTGLNIGLQPGDIILEISGTKITSSEQLEAVMKKSANGWQIAYRRGGNVLVLTVKM